MNNNSCDNMNKKVLGVDVDGVITKSLEDVLPPLMKERFRTVYERVGRHKVGKIQECVVKKGMSFYFNYKWNNLEKVKLSDKLIPVYLEKLSETYEIKIITSTYGNIEKVKTWLLQNKINYPVLHVPAYEKLKYCDILIDDRYDVLASLKHNQLGILYAKQNIENKKSNIVVISSWKEIYNFLLSNPLKEEEK